MDNGVSKKHSVFMSCVTGLLGLAANVDDKLPFAYIILGMFIVYHAGQGFLDYLDKKKYNQGDR